MRRRDLFLGFSALWAASQLRAIGPRSEISVGHVRHRGAWNPRPDALHRLLWETTKRTSITTAQDAAVVDVADGTTAESAELFFQPLLILTAAGQMPPLEPKERSRLERHLRFGGTLVVDAPPTEQAFLSGIAKELAAIFPSIPLRPLPDDHVILKSFYLLEGAVGRFRHDRRLQALDLGGRAAVIVSSNDLLGAWEKDAFGAFRFACEPDGENQRELAFRLGVNLMMYATCIDYKEDQVHIPFIMRKKRR